MGEDTESRIRRHCEAKAFDDATTEALRGYGDEVFGFLIGRMRDEDRASDVFSEACEDLWRSLPAFEWRCSMRSWFYRLARNAAVRYERSPAHKRRVGLSRVSEVVEQVRSRTLAHLRSEVKDEMRRLRDRLDPDEQTLLILRVDRDLSWTEIAEIMTEDAVTGGPAAQRAAARLRQRFQKLKTRLREIAIAEGLLRVDG